LVLSVIAVYVPDMVDKNHLPKLAHTYQEEGRRRGWAGVGKGCGGRGWFIFQTKKIKATSLGWHKCRKGEFGGGGGKEGSEFRTACMFRSQVGIHSKQ
jgi:hypothetical protein